MDHTRGRPAPRIMPGSLNEAALIQPWVKAAKAFDDRNDVRPLIAILRGNTATSLLSLSPVCRSLTALPFGQIPRIQSLICLAGMFDPLPDNALPGGRRVCRPVGLRVLARRRKGEAL